ncbi:hypothetical protein [Pontimicrobium sp. MEBiC06410]
MFIIGAVIIGTITALSQLFADAFPEDISIARSKLSHSKKIRYEKGLEAIALLEKINESERLPKSLFIESKNIILEYNEYKKKTINNASNLKKIKNSHKINGFPNLNSFLDGIGMPVLVFVIAIIFFLLYVYRKVINFNEISKSFLFVSLLCFFSSSVYLIWALSPKLEINKAIYISGLICSSIVAVLFLIKFLKYIFNSDKEYKLQKAITAISRFAFIDVKKHLKEDNETKEAYRKEKLEALKKGM